MKSMLGGVDAPPQCEGATPAKSGPHEISTSNHSEDHTRISIRSQLAVRLPAIDCDLLSGLRQIAAWYGLTVAQVRAKIAAGEIIVFFLPGRTTVYALKSSQTKRWREAEEAYINRKLAVGNRGAIRLGLEANEANT
jgi:hypothetical protein